MPPFSVFNKDLSLIAQSKPEVFFYVTRTSATSSFLPWLVSVGLLPRQPRPRPPQLSRPQP